MTKVELAWAAGLFEGEGTVAITRSHPVRGCTTLRVVMSNTNRDIVGYFQRRWPAAKVRVRPVKATQNHQEAFIWELAGPKAAVFLKAIRPFVQSTRMKQRIDLALEYQACKRQGIRKNRLAYHHHLFVMYLEMTNLNAKGRRAASR